MKKNFINLLAMLVMFMATPAMSQREIKDSTTQFGPGTATDIILKAMQGSTPSPALKFNDTLDKWQKSDDGTNFLNFGDVVGPASSTDNCLSTFDLTTGKLIQCNSPAVLSDAGVITGLTGLTSSGSVTASGALNLSSTSTSALTGSNVLLATATSSVIRLTSASLVSVGGYANTTAGRRTHILNNTGVTITILNEDATQTAANRIVTGTGNNIKIKDGGAFDLQYNSTTARHHIVGGAGGSGVGGSRLNLLTDSSFEDNVAEGSCSGCTATQESTIILATPTNEKALKMAFSASTGCYTVDKTTTANLVDVQGSVSAWIRTDQLGVTFTSRRNGADTNNVLSVANAGKYDLYEIPDILGSTSFGYKICASSSITGNVYVDETFVGPKDVKIGSGIIEIQNSSVIPGSNVSGNVTGAFTSSNGVTSLYSYNSGTGVYTVLRSAEFTVVAQNRTSSAATAHINVILNGSEYTGSDTVVGSGYQTTTTMVKDLSVGDTFSCNNSGSASTAAQTKCMVSAKYSTKANSYSSTNGDTGWVSCGHTISDFSGFGTVTNIETHCKRHGSDLLMKGKFTAGTTAASEARVGLKLNGAALISAGLSIIPSRQRAGTALSTTNPGSGYLNNAAILIEASLGYFMFASPTTSNPIATSTGISMQTASTVLTFDARIPIAGWETSNVIIGSFNQVVTTPGNTKPVIVSANVSSSGVVTEDESDFINGNCVNSPTGTYTCTHNSGFFGASSVVHCWMTNQNGGPYQASATPASSVLTTRNSGGTIANGAFILFCKGQQ